MRTFGVRRKRLIWRAMSATATIAMMMVMDGSGTLIENLLARVSATCCSPCDEGGFEIMA
jgi:hypothetical protein